MTSCPDEGTIQSFVEATLPGTELPAVEDHVADCTTCRQLVAALRTESAELASGTAPTIVAPPVIASGTVPTVVGTAPTMNAADAAIKAPPTTIGRYEILELIGAGGMGLVFEARDPELRRQIAIKLLRGRDDDLGQRLIREARAMAEIQHPNVVAVYDVGKHGEHEVYVAMELVRGSNLRKWQTSMPRSERAVIDAYQQAGRGLAAAHAVGLVHRDFKPDNVLIGDDGRIRVTDFGLARHGGTEERASRASRRSLENLTLTGALNGTPGYVAPEQYAHGKFDARSDQFAYCVAVWEALAGNRPFRGTTLEAIEQATLARTISEPGTPIRPAIRKILERGFAIDPAERWGSIDELLAALDATQSRGKRRYVIGGIVVAALAITGIAAVGALQRREPAEEVYEPRLAAESAELSQRILSGDREGAPRRADEIVAATRGGPDHAAALTLRGFVHYALAEYDKAEPVLVEAVNLAEAAGDRRTKAIALGQLVNTLEELGKTEDAKRWSGMVVASARKQASVTLGHALNADASRKWNARKHDEALASYQAGAEVWALTGDFAGWAMNRDLLATNLLSALQYEPACALAKATLATFDLTPRILSTDLARLEDAMVEASVASTAAMCELGRNDPKAAIPFAERAVAATTRRFGEQSSYLDTPLTSLAQAYEALGDFTASEKTYARALALPGNETEKLTRLGLMTVGAVNANRLPLAVSRAELLVARSAKVYPADHATHIAYRVLLGKLLVKSKLFDRSRPLFEELLPLAQKLDPLTLADVRFYLARSINTADVPRARELSAQARTVYVAAGSQRAPHLVLLDEFLQTLQK